MFMSLIVKKLLKGRKAVPAAVVLPLAQRLSIRGRNEESNQTRSTAPNVICTRSSSLPNGVFNPYTGIKTNLLFFTKGGPTERIWFYEHRYPVGQKSYSKTKPLRIEELQPIADWWGKESNGFKDRVETEEAWVLDFGLRQAHAEAEARPHWDRAEAFSNLSDRNL